MGKGEVYGKFCFEGRRTQYEAAGAAIYGEYFIMLSLVRLHRQKFDEIILRG